MLSIRKINNMSIFSLILLYITHSSLAFSSTVQKPYQDIKTLIPAFEAQYNILRQSDVVGKATRKLSYIDEHSAVYSLHTNIKWFIFSDIRIENSVVQVDNGIIMPTSFEYTREGTGSDKHYKLQFDNKTHQATDVLKNKVISTKLPTNIQDQLSHHLTLQQALITNKKPLSPDDNFTFNVIKASGKHKDYTYAYVGKEEIMLPYGLVKTIKFKQENDAKTRITYAWFAPELNYVLVKLFQTKNDVEQFESQLTDLKVEIE